MIFLVDGYNVTKGDPATSGLSLEAQREALIARVRARGAGLLGAGRTVIVFDGMGGSGGSREQAGSVEIRYAREGSADDVLASLAGHAAQKVCLVSSDRELGERVRVHARHGWETRPREVLYDSATPRTKARRGGDRTRAAGLPEGANRITAELKKLWLDGDDEEEN